MERKEGERKGYWVEESASGERFYCHKAWRGGKKVVVRKTLSEIESILKLESK